MLPTSSDAGDVCCSDFSADERILQSCLYFQQQLRLATAQQQGIAEAPPNGYHAVVLLTHDNLFKLRVSPLPQGCSEFESPASSVHH
jgi:hypothetical protein